MTGHGAPWNGDIAEILVYNTNLSDIARQQVENYLREQIYHLASRVRRSDLQPGGGHLWRGADVTISTTTNGATIRYTTDGSEPTETAGTRVQQPGDYQQHQYQYHAAGDRLCQRLRG